MKTEHEIRESGINQSFEELGLIEDQEFFSQPENRLNFIQGLTADEFITISNHINARSRDINPREQRISTEKGGSLMLLATPTTPEDRRKALELGFEEIQTYLRETTDTTEQKIEGASMALEALIIWAHPFEDGNGRTSRFWGKFILDGTADNKDLADTTTDKKYWQREYGFHLRTDKGNEFRGQNLDNIVSFTEDERIEIGRNIDDEVEPSVGIARSVGNLAANHSFQQAVKRKQREYLGYVTKADEVAARKSK